MNGEKEESYKKAAGSGFFIASIIFISFCLRGPITTVGPQVGEIGGELLVSSSVMGIVTTLPPLAFGFFSPFVGLIGKKLGSSKTILLALTGILTGILIRSSDGVATLFFGTILMSLGIAVANVMIPSLIRGRFPERVGTMTSVYTTAMGSFAAIGAGASIPISMSLGWGWRGALGVWALPTAAAMIMWLIGMRKSGMENPVITAGKDAAAESVKKKTPENAKKNVTENAGKDGAGHSVWKSKTAWCITMFMGLQSLLFYSTSSWMPTIVQDHGVSPQGASLLALTFQLTGIFASMMTSFVYGRTKRQELLGFGIGILFMAGLCGLLLSENHFVYLFLILACAGLASGGSLSWILTIIGTLGKDADQTADLSGMAQCVGYLLAAVGPLLSGFLYDLTGTWTWTVHFYMTVALLLALFGFIVGRRKTMF